MQNPNIQAKVLGQLSLMQSVMLGLPDEISISAFVRKGFGDIPGVCDVEFSTTNITNSQNKVSYSISKSEELYLIVELDNEEIFSPYEQYISNFALMLSLIFEERRQRKEIELHKNELEDRVEERTCQLRNEVEERIIIEESLQKSEELFRMSFDHAIIGSYMLDGSGSFIKCNPAFCQMIGYQESELRETDIFHHIDKADVDVTKQELNQLISGEKNSTQLEIKYICKSGNNITAKISATAVRNSLNEFEFIISYISDITEQKRLLNLLSTSEIKYRSLFDNLTTGMVLLKIIYNNEGALDDYIITEVNHAFSEISGITQESATGHTIQDILPGFSDMSDDWLQTAIVSGRLEVSEEYIESLDRYFDIWIFFPSSEHCAIMLSDVTERMIAQEMLIINEQKLKEQNEEYEALNEELNESNVQLQISKEKAEESDRLKSSFLANMSHEIRTPMNGIIGFSELISAGDISEQKRQYYSDIVKNSCIQLLSIVNDIIDISKIETGQISINENKVNINDLLLQLYSFFKPLSQSNNISIYQSKGLNDREATIYTDDLKLKQIMTNFLSNAAKFTHKGHIQFGYQLIGDDLEFFVEDTGIGIAEEDQHLIFDRFAQARKTDANQYGGTGLGLAIAKAFIEKLGGTVTLQSKLNFGSRFSFSLPYRPVFAENEVDIQNIETNMSKPTILVVEDEEVNYLYLEEVLKKFGLCLLHAKNGAETIQFINSNHKIDLIMLDIKLPDTNGLLLIPQIQSARPGIPIVAQTAYAMSGDCENALNMGCSDYISKPIIRQSLIEILSKYIQMEKIDSAK